MPRSQPGELHGRWKGDPAKPQTKHTFVKRRKEKTGVCQICGKKPSPYRGSDFGTDWANVREHKYSHNPDDYVELCRSCHMLYDNGKVELRGSQ